jgi:hypothetical protein
VESFSCCLMLFGTFFFRKMTMRLLLSPSSSSRPPDDDHFLLLRYYPRERRTHRFVVFFFFVVLENADCSCEQKASLFYATRRYSHSSSRSTSSRRNTRSYSILSREEENTFQRNEELSVLVLSSRSVPIRAYHSTVLSLAFFFYFEREELLSRFFLG